MVECIGRSRSPECTWPDLSPVQMSVAPPEGDIITYSRLNADANLLSERREKKKSTITGKILTREIVCYDELMIALESTRAIT